jgi:fatty acid desaturase
MSTNERTPTTTGSAQWPLTGADKLSKNALKSLRQRSNGPGLCFFAAHLSALLVGGLLLHLSLGSWAVIPVMFLHGTVIVLLFAPLHECSHFTAFRSRWLNYLVGIFAGVVTLRPFFYFKWRHAEHHTYTQSAEHDPDHAAFPDSMKSYGLMILGAEFWPRLLGSLSRCVTGKFTQAELAFIPQASRRQVCWETRLTVLVYLLVAVVSVALQSWAAVLYWMLPRILGEPVLRAIRMAEHIGTDECPDLLRNTRTTLANPLLCTLYWNMSYHTEHHVATSVPFHALKRMHLQLRPHLANVASGYWDVHEQIVRQVLANQRRRQAASG